MSVALGMLLGGACRQATGWMETFEEAIVPGCVLRVSGSRETITSVLEATSLEFAESRADQRARRLGRAASEREATFVLTVSDASGDRVGVQVSEASAWLAAHVSELARLMSTDGLDRAVLDFGWEIPGDAGHRCERFPRDFLALCARLGLDIEVSAYLVGAQETNG